jgi:hypothetical protein
VLVADEGHRYGKSRTVPRLDQDADKIQSPNLTKRILSWGGVAFLVFFVAFRPASAANVFSSIGAGLMDIATGCGDFFSNLVK